MWQERYSELHPKGLEIVTVALDTDGVEAVRPWIEAANPGYVCLIDHAHVVDELFGVVNVPSGVWINEEGMIVRPPETAYPQRPSFLDREIPMGATPSEIVRSTEVKKLRIDAEGYIAALRDWVAHGAASRFALAPEEVVRRSGPRSVAASTAAAHFELGQHLHRIGRCDDAINHFREAYHLQPDNWTYKRQAWSLLAPGQSPIALYGSDWISDVQKIGAENYYPPLDL